MKRLFTKPCSICSVPVEGVKRKDRDAYYYPRRCTECARKTHDPAILEKKREVLRRIRRQVPVGSTHTHRASEGFVYIKQKVAEPNQWDYQHRIVAATSIDRKVSPDEIVHHINEVTTDNHADNLQVMPAGQHTRLHHAIDTWSARHTCCVECGTSTRKHTAKGLCSACYQANATKSRGVSVTCEACGNAFNCLPVNINRGNGRFCSKSCAGAYGNKKRYGGSTIPN